MPKTILVIKRELLCNFRKTLKGRHFKALGQSGTGLKFSIIIGL